MFFGKSVYKEEHIVIVNKKTKIQEFFVGRMSAYAHEATLHCPCVLFPYGLLITICIAFKALHVNMTSMCRYVPPSDCLHPLPHIRHVTSLKPPYNEL